MALTVRKPSILLLDNRDSFVWNLAQALQLLGASVRVVRSDRISLGELTAELATPPPRALVLSPGPGRPEHAGICVDAVRTCSGTIPVLGICLGHQAIALAFGATIKRTAPCHGKAWAIEHQGRGLFDGLPTPLRACRYHSLVVDPTALPVSLLPDAHTPEGQLMSLRHSEHATYGLQFHPESFRTEYGLELLQNFLRTVK